MNTFQQQYLSVLGAAAGSKFLKAAGKIAGTKDSLSKDKTYKNDMSAELEEVGYSKETNKFLTNETARAQDEDPLGVAAKAYVEIQEKTIGLSKANQELERGRAAYQEAQARIEQTLNAKNKGKRNKLHEIEVTMSDLHNILGGKK